jgi:cytosine deaminase
MIESFETRLEAVVLPGRPGIYTLILRDGVVAAIEPWIGDEPRWVGLPGLVNLHAHADRAFAAESFRAVSLADAVDAAAKARAVFTAEDVRKRATAFFEQSIAHGVTRVRTHTDVDPVVELRSMEGVLSARRDVADRLDVEIIAFATSRNDLAQPDGRDRIERAVGLKPDLVGASLNSSAEPKRALDSLLTLAERHGLSVDLHIDEHLEPGRMLAPMVADAVIARGMQGRVSFSHLCALAILDESSARAVIDKIARAQITVIALPETNLLLQDRGQATPRRRGITLLRELIAAGVEVRLGTDNVRDWFFPFGDGDMLETGRLTAMTAHLDDTSELVSAICGGFALLEEGMPGDLALIPATSFEDALARRPAGRAVFKGGRRIV